MRLLADDFFKGRDNAKFHKRDENAEKAYGDLSTAKRALLRFMPVCVGVVDWGEWPDDDPRKGTPRVMPMYLIRHIDTHGKEHLGLSYKQGFAGHSERLSCPCGYRHYTSSVVIGQIKSVGQMIALAFRLRKSRRA